MPSQRLQLLAKRRLALVHFQMAAGLFKAAFQSPPLSLHPDDARTPPARFPGVAFLYLWGGGGRYRVILPIQSCRSSGGAVFSLERGSGAEHCGSVGGGRFERFDNIRA